MKNNKKKIRGYKDYIFCEVHEKDSDNYTKTYTKGIGSKKKTHNKKI